MAVDSENRRNRLFIFNVLLLCFIFAVVIGGSYQIRHAANEENRLHNYATEQELNLKQAQMAYTRAKESGAKLQELIDRREALVQAYWSLRELEPAIALYGEQMRETWGLAPTSYNKNWVETCRKLGNLHRDAAQLDAAKACYESVLDHDKKYMSSDKALIARDLGAMAALHYLLGSGEEKSEARIVEFKKGIDFADQALAMLKEAKLDDSPREAAVLWNLYLLKRDSGDQNGADIARTRARNLDERANRLCKEP